MVVGTLGRNLHHRGHILGQKQVGYGDLTVLGGRIISGLTFRRSGKIDETPAKLGTVKVRSRPGHLRAGFKGFLLCHMNSN